MKKGFLFFVFSLISLMTFAQPQIAPEWTNILSDQPKTFRIQLVSSSENSVRVNVQVPGFYTTTVTTPRGEAKIVSLPKSVSTAKAGEPNVPMTGIPVMIGDQARMDIRVLDAQYQDFDGIEVAPSKGDFSRQIDPATVPYTYGECYNRDAFFPDNNVMLYEPYIIRDFRGQNMAVYPFAYNPSTKTLRVYYNMTVEMYKVDDKGENVIASRKSNTVKMDADFNSMYQRHFINYDAGMAKYTAVNEEGDLLIICYDNFISAMTDFVNWKKTRGVNTTIVGTSTISSSLTYSNLKTYIQNQYNANNNLTHVLLVGDVAQIPGYSYTGGGSEYSGLGDNPYGQVVGNDIYNDIFVGRFSAQTVAQVTTQVNRVITYERDLTTSATWLQNGDGISKKEGGSGHNSEDDYQHMDNIRTDLIGYGYNTVYQDYSNLSGYTGTATSISSHINSGVGIVNYCNHGNLQMWGVASYSNTHVNNLTNSNKLPFIWSVACLVGKYDNTSTSYGSNYTIGQNNDCFAEAWMHATYSNTDLTPTGAIGALMSYISQPWIPPMWAQDECIDILVESYSSNIKHTWGGTSINGLMGIFDHYSTSSNEAVGTYQAWVLYGDPTLMLRTKTPQAMTVTHPESINLAATTYTVNVTNGNGALATITDANHNILGSATVSNGTATISISGNLTPVSTLTLCVFGYNKVTYLGTITVTGGTQYDITCNQPEHGSISVPGQAYASTFVTLTATPETGYCLSAWDVRDANNNLITVTNNQFIMPESDVTVSATFVEGLAITLASVTNGSISADPSYALQGTTVNLTATPATGYNFDRWVVFKTGDVNTTVTMTDNSFTMPNYDVTVSAIFLAPAGGDVTIGSGTSTNAYIPTYAWYKYSLVQQIYTASEVGEAGTITKVAFKVANSKEATRTIDIYLSHTSTNTFSSTSSWISQSTSYRVFSGDVTFATSGWTTITLDTPFEYNGTSNLLLTVDDNTGSYVSSSGNSPTFYVYSGNSNTAIYKYNDGTDYNPASMSTSGTLLGTKNQVVFTKEIPSTDSYISVSSDNLTGFTYAEGEGPSEAQGVALIGVNLQDNLTVTMPTGYEVSGNGSTFSTTLSLTPSSGNLQQMLYVRLAADLSEDNYNGTMTLVSGEATQNVALNGEVTDGSGFSYPCYPYYPWIPSSNYSGDGMALTAQIQINGVPVDRATWEVGAFCGDECRGAITPLTDWTDVGMGYFVDMNILGNDGDVISFYLYDTEAESILRAKCYTTVVLVNDSYIGQDVFNDLFVLNFMTKQTFTKDIFGYTGEKDYYYLIASPIGTINPENVTDLLANSYDLYYFDQAQELEWRNYKEQSFELETGKGYLYANSENVTLTFTGFPYDGDGKVHLTYDENAELKGWNLVGNPFAETAYIDRSSFYKMNSECNEIIAASGSIEAMEGIFVVAETDGEPLTFSTGPGRQVPALVMNITRNSRGAAIDRAIIQFGGGRPLPKFMLGKNNTKLYIPQNDKNYSVVNANANAELPLHFKASENGTYILKFSFDNVNFNYLHLIDNMTGMDIDLLTNTSYTFEARTSDYASRFRLVFNALDDSDD